MHTVNSYVPVKLRTRSIPFQMPCIGKYKKVQLCEDFHQCKMVHTIARLLRLMSVRATDLEVEVYGGTLMPLSDNTLLGARVGGQEC